MYDRAVKEQKNPKRKFSFGYYVGMGIVNYTRQKYELAVDFFAKAITHNVNCDSSVRVAFASCCFKLGQYDRAKASLKKTLSLDVRTRSFTPVHNFITCSRMYSTHAPCAYTLYSILIVYMSQSSFL